MTHIRPLSIHYCLCSHWKALFLTCSERQWHKPLFPHHTIFHLCFNRQLRKKMSCVKNIVTLHWAVEGGKGDRNVQPTAFHMVVPMQKPRIVLGYAKLSNKIHSIGTDIVRFHDVLPTVHFVNSCSWIMQCVFKSKPPKQGHREHNSS